jgi:hypothetical protein
MKKIYNVLFILLPFSMFAQIGREFNFGKGKNGLTKSRAITYMNVKLDKQGMPLPQTENEGEIITFFRDDYPYEIQSFEEMEGKNELMTRILLERNGKDIKKAAIYIFLLGKESLLRAHEAFYVNGKMTLENITNEKGELLGTAQYEEGKIADGIQFIKFKGKGSRYDIELERQYDDEGDVFVSEYIGGKMKSSSRRISVVTQDSLTKIKYLILYNNDEKLDSIKLTTYTHFDKNGNPVLSISHYENPKAHSEVEKEMITATYCQNFYGKEDEVIKTNFPTNEGIEGEWKSEKDNLTVFFVKDNDKYEFACFPKRGHRKIYPELEEKETMVAYEDGWKEDLIAINNGTYEYDPKTGKVIIHLHNGNIVHLLAKIEWNTLILTPEKGDRNALRLVKIRK